jgi:3-oxoacyl-[acyl-carrier protein] reductase
MAHELAGHVALITGGGRGFGKAIAKTFAAEGAAVTITARSTKQIDQTVAEIKAAGGKAFAVPGDVTHRKDVERVVSAAHRHFGPTTLLVNNAGLSGPFGPVGTLDPDEWWSAQAVHVLGPFLYMSFVLPEMIRAKKGRIINVARVGGTRVLTEQVATEVKPHGVSVFAIRWEAQSADMCMRLASGRYDGLSGRYLTPEDDFDALLKAAQAT